MGGEGLSLSVLLKDVSAGIKLAHHGLNALPEEGMDPNLELTHNSCGGYDMRSRSNSEQTCASSAVFKSDSWPAVATVAKHWVQIESNVPSGLRR
jgi:hypothetical protein